MNILWADLKVGTTTGIAVRADLKVGTTTGIAVWVLKVGTTTVCAMTVVVLAFRPAESPLRECRDCLGRDAGETTKIAGLAPALIAWPTREIGNFRRDADESRTSKRL